MCKRFGFDDVLIFVVGVGASVVGAHLESKIVWGLGVGGARHGTTELMTQVKERLILCSSIYLERRLDG
jgi:hypothetical protein